MLIFFTCRSPAQGLDLADARGDDRAVGPLQRGVVVVGHQRLGILGVGGLVDGWVRDGGVGLVSHIEKIMYIFLILRTLRTRLHPIW